MPKITQQLILSDTKELIKPSKARRGNSYGTILKELVTQLQKQDFSGLPGNRRLKVNRQQRERRRDGRTYFPELILRGNWLEEAGINYNSRVCIIPINGALIIRPEGECTKPDVELIGRAIF